MVGDEETWRTIYESLLHLLRTKQSEAEALAGDRALLKDRFFGLQERWRGDVSCLQGRIDEMLAERSLWDAKMDLFTAMGREEVSVCEMKSDDAYSDLEALEAALCLLISEVEQKQMSDEQVKESEEDTSRVDQAGIWRGEIKQLKLANSKIVSEKNAELHFLLQERNFLWNQFKKNDSDYSNILKGKCLELEQAIKQIEELRRAGEESNQLIEEKGMTIDTLKERIANQDKNIDECSREVSLLSNELELLKRSVTSTPMQLRSCLLIKSISGSRRSVVIDPESRKSPSNDLLTPTVKKVSWADLKYAGIETVQEQEEADLNSKKSLARIKRPLFQ